jgi:hypothetical protein
MVLTRTPVTLSDHIGRSARNAAGVIRGFYCSEGAKEVCNWTGNWLGVEMCFSHFGAEANEQLLRDAGFVIEHARVVEQDNEDARFLWVVARVEA